MCVLLHGRGRDTEDVLSLADRIGDPEVAFLAPAARDGTWYPQSFLAPLVDNEPWLSSALGVVEALMTSLGDHSRVVLGGFSQGACLAAEYALRFPGATAGCCSTPAGSSGRRARCRRGWAPSRGRRRISARATPTAGSRPSGCARRRRR